MEYDPTASAVMKQAVFETSFDGETNSMVMDGYSTRKEALNMRKRALLLLNQLTEGEEDIFIAYLARTYFDRFASREQLRDEDLQLAVVCCISLASKLRNASFPMELLLKNNRSHVNINEDRILEMETRILTSLSWRLRAVDAFWFVGYYLRMLPDDLRPSQHIVHDIIIQAEDIGFTRFRPSVIAASATFTASSVQFPGRFVECLDKIRSWNRVNMEELNQCTEMIKRMCGDKSLSGETQRTTEEESMPKHSETMEDTQSDELNRRPEKEPETGKELGDLWSKLKDELNAIEEELNGGSHCKV